MCACVTRQKWSLVYSCSVPPLGILCNLASLLLAKLLGFLLLLHGFLCLAHLQASAEASSAKKHWALHLAVSLHLTHLALGLDIVLLDLPLTLGLFLHDVGFSLVVEQELVVTALRVLQFTICNLQAACVSASTAIHPTYAQLTLTVTTLVAILRRKYRSWETAIMLPSKLAQASSSISLLGMSRWLVGSSKTRSVPCRQSTTVVCSLYWSDAVPAERDQYMRGRGTSCSTDSCQRGGLTDRFC